MAVRPGVRGHLVSALVSRLDCRRLVVDAPCVKQSEDVMLVDSPCLKRNVRTVKCSGEEKGSFCSGLVQLVHQALGVLIWAIIVCQS